MIENAIQLTGIKRGRYLVLLFVFLVVGRGAEVLAETNDAAPWEKTRSLADFDSLLHHSPFSLPTAEESSPLADRYSMTGIVTIGGVQQIFIIDKTDQSRDVLTLTPNSNNMSLVSLVREGDAAPQKATIRVGGEVGTIGFAEAAPQQALATPAAVPPGSPAAGVAPPRPRLPQLPQAFGAATQTPEIPHAFRRITHPMINAPQPVSAAPTQ